MARIHPIIPKLIEQLEARRIDRREFLRTSTLLGLSATAAYGVVGRVLGESAIPKARAQGKPGGTLRVAMEVQKMDDPGDLFLGADVEPDPAHRRIPRDHRARQRHPADARRELGSLRRPQDLDLPPAPGRAVAQWRGVHGRPRGLERRALAQSRPRLVQHRALDLRQHRFGRGGRPAHGALQPQQARALGARGLLQLPDRDPAPVVHRAVLRQPDRHRALYARRAARGRRPLHPPADHRDHRRQGVQVLGRAALSRRDPLLPFRRRQPAHRVRLGRRRHDLRVRHRAVRVRRGAAGRDRRGRDRADAVLPLQGHRAAVRQPQGAPGDGQGGRQLGLSGPRLPGEGGVGENHHVSPIHPEYFQLPTLARDVEGAKALLEEAGHGGGLEISIDVGNTDGPWHQTRGRDLARPARRRSGSTSTST